jgi:hypothetical protein
MMRLDHQYHYELTAEKIDALVAQRRAPVPSPHRGEGQAEGLKPARPRKKKSG